MKMNFAIILSILLSSQMSLAASSGSLSLSGAVTAVNSLVVTANGTNNTSLNILSGETAKNVAAVAETSNDALGYTIKLYSANAGQLVHTVDNTKKTAYTLSYNGGSYAAPSTSATPATVKSVSSLAGLTTSTSQILVNVTAFPTAIAGTYTDTVTISITGN